MADLTKEKKMESMYFLILALPIPIKHLKKLITQVNT